VLPLNWIEPSENDPNQKSNQFAYPFHSLEFQNPSFWSDLISMPAHACIYEEMEVRLESHSQDGDDDDFGQENERTSRVKQSAPGETLCLSQGIW